MLQLPKVLPFALKSNLRVSEELFDQWLSLLEIDHLVTSLLNDAKADVPLNVPGNSFMKNVAARNSLPSMFPAGSARPLSPRRMTLGHK